MKSITVFGAMVLMTAVGLLSCTKGEQKEEMAAKKMMHKAVARMNATTGNEAHGTVTFTHTDAGIRVVAHFEGVPEGEHGFHIHEKGDCSSGDGTSAGGHFNPDNSPHAGPDAEMRHVGDLGNITANAEGVAEKDFVDSMLSLEGEHSIVGKAVILHAQVDDLTTQPTGNAGARISCGVIEMADDQSTMKE